MLLAPSVVAQNTSTLSETWANKAKRSEQVALSMPTNPKANAARKAHDAISLVDMMVAGRRNCVVWRPASALAEHMTGTGAGRGTS